MKGQMPDFIAKTVREIGEGEKKKNCWSDVGVAFLGKETITVYMDTVPLNGKIVLVKPLPKEEEQKKMNPFGRVNGRSAA